MLFLLISIIIFIVYMSFICYVYISGIINIDVYVGCYFGIIFQG